MDENIITYDTKWAHIFSLPEHWAIKAFNESLRIYSGETFMTGIYHERFKQITLPFRQTRRKYQNQNNGGNIESEQSRIFSDEFFISCLKTRLENVAKSPICNKEFEKENVLIMDDITKILKDDTYR